MPPVFWTGRLSPPMKFIVNLNNLLAWITGNARDIAAMKRRTKLGYEGACSDHVTHYDDFGRDHYTKIAINLLEKVDLQGKEVLEIGCGTGIVSVLVLQRGAARLTCGDISQYMLGQCQKKIFAQGYGPGKAEFRELDAEALPYNDDVFDGVVSGMLLGLVPDQQKVVNQMARVIRPGGFLAFSTHGPDCWWETSDAAFRVIPKRFTLGYRVEYWPRRDVDIRRMLERSGLADIKTDRLFWQDNFPTGSQAYDFFAAVSASWWHAKFPPDKVAAISRKTRDYFEEKKVTRITQEIILAYGRKP